MNGVMEGKVLVAEAARLMGVSERHAWRLLRAYRKEGVAGVAHGNRGRRPSTTTCPEIQEKVMELATGAYSGFNHSPEMPIPRAGPFARTARPTIINGSIVLHPPFCTGYMLSPAIPIGIAPPALGAVRQGAGDDANANRLECQGCPGAVGGSLPGSAYRQRPCQLATAQ